MKIENEIYQHLRVFLFLIFLFVICFFFVFVFGFINASSRPPAGIIIRATAVHCLPLLLPLLLPFVRCSVGNAVNITEFNVPSSYVIEDEENPGTLILDCAYESEPNEKGVVLKWLLNGTLIYQWIPDRPPAHSFVSIQSHPNDLIRCIFFSRARRIRTFAKRYTVK